MSNFIFRLPLDSQLTDTQRIALEYDTSMVVSGGPGSGKTVVTIYKFLVPIKNQEQAILFTYNKTLLASIRGLLLDKSDVLFGDLNQSKINNVIANNVASFSKFYGDIEYDDENAVEKKFKTKIGLRGGNKFKEIFFDEAQDLTPAVFANAFLLADKVSCGADDAQNLQGHFPPDEAISSILEKLNSQGETDLQQLESNFRNTKEIFEFARKFVPDDENVQEIDTSELGSGELPEVLENLSDAEQLERIKLIIENNPSSNIGVLVNYRNHVDKIKDFLETHNYSCKENAPNNLSFSYYYNGMNLQDEIAVFRQLKTPFILTYDSCKGLEFDIVIMPFFNDCQNALSIRRKLRVKDDFGKIIDAKDANGYQRYETNADGSTKMFATRNHYYVGATRARTQLFILCANKPEILNFHTTPVVNNQNVTNHDDLPF